MNIASSRLRSDLPMQTQEAIKLRATEADRPPLLRQYLRIATRWRYVILGVVATCVLLGLIVTFLMTPKYTAEATVEISRESDQVTQFQGVEREAGADPIRTATLAPAIRASGAAASACRRSEIFCSVWSV
jgi:succinoglycan biosynthesis transport protein ExoP